MSALRAALETLAAELHTQGWSQGPRYAARVRALLAEPDESQMALTAYAVQHNRANYLEAECDTLAAKLARIEALADRWKVAADRWPENYRYGPFADGLRAELAEGSET